mmetsp:Transcript_28338/g.48175  ORF Transcript_28338/g.48175 Transcript_28338/m.48175 type:complete len:437 (+) Transcript_28338:101-1411(+)|eukprot:CAMPEP_0183722660 /NCGR_PEP_ID=MMETSP0737-20130205/14540_1 /TAXON_ID=385413 /ORGANISM="Thalassiosira miniscula, Strain CCMP1093" /LENGTH=436 /DNA_ID=CAMNT_0025952871 /DNA_START=188 /DNA_END=1498 /DNA_ORIENTATION=-
MEDRPLSFVHSNHHPSDGALASIGGSGGGVALLLPNSPLREPDAAITNDLWSLSLYNNRNNNNNNKCTMALPAMAMMTATPTPNLNYLSTYTAGEDGGRLANMAREFGLARVRPPKRQIRKHAFQAFLRNQPDNLTEDILLQSPQSTPETNEKVSSPPSFAPSPTTPQRHPPLRFVFSGYSLWLELHQTDIDTHGRGDLDRAMIDAADRFHLGGAIPSPHVTALYGIDIGMEEDEMRRVFREDVRRVLLELAEKKKNSGSHGSSGKLWPDLDATGIICDVEFDGVNGGEMDMAWAEVSFATSPEHETLINALYDVFYRRRSVVIPDSSSSSSSSSSTHSNEEKEEVEQAYPPRTKPWVPHLSLCYDNPEGFGPNLTRLLIEDYMREKCPTLASVLDDDPTGVKFSRAVSGISLWRTAGTMAEWKCLERFEFPSLDG